MGPGCSRASTSPTEACSSDGRRRPTRRRRVQRGRLHRPVRRDARPREPPRGRALAGRLGDDRPGRRARRPDRGRDGRLLGRRPARLRGAEPGSPAPARAGHGLRDPGVDRARDARAVLELLRHHGGDDRDLRRGQARRRAAHRRHDRRRAGRARPGRRRAGRAAARRLPAARRGGLLAGDGARGRRAVRRGTLRARRRRPCRRPGAHAGAGVGPGRRRGLGGQAAGARARWARSP